MWDVIEVIAAFWGAMLITYAAIFVVGCIGRGVDRAARGGNKWLRSYLKRA
jgi:hypothetical protein